MVNLENLQVKNAKELFFYIKYLLTPAAQTRKFK